jgi:hypothetical protein
MELKAEPAIALCDERINITISGLSLGEKVRIDASI